MIQTENHVFTGLQQDTSVSKQQSEYLIDAHNIRITAKDGETLLSITNEKGPKELVLKRDNSNYSITGTILGHCVLNNYLVLFVKGVNDSILKIDMSTSNPEVTIMFNGSLGFNVNNPIEAIGDYENENIQKVYWTDGINQPRFLNLIHAPYTWNGAFDFVPTLQLNENVTIVRETSTAGQFPAGVIQYAFSYYNKHGQETNIFYTTPLHNISFYDRGASPETVVSNSFNITITGVDTHFDYLRIYSILRTSLDATPICKRVIDLSTNDCSTNYTLKYTDTGVNGSNIDPTSLLYIGGEEIVAGSICSKDGTLFLGNLSLKRSNIHEVRGNTYILASESTVTTFHKSVQLTPVTTSGYVYYNGLRSTHDNTDSNTAGFKVNEKYRLGLQAQYKNGKWSDPIYIQDYIVNTSNKPSINGATLSKTCIQCSINPILTSKLHKAGYRKIRPVVVFPELQDRSIICQGVLNPTLYTNTQRTTDRNLSAQSSWFFRPLHKDITSVDTYLSKVDAFTATTSSPFNAHNKAIPSSSNEITGNNTFNPKYLRMCEIQGSFVTNNQFIVDNDFVTLHSPEITFDDTIYHIDLSNIKCREVGEVEFTNTFSDILISTSTPTISSDSAGFIHKSYSSEYSRGIGTGLYYEDFIVDEYDSGKLYRAYDLEKSPCKWLVYPWQSNGSLNNDANRPSSSGDRTAVLNKKVISNLRYSQTTWLDNKTLSLVTGVVPQVFSSNEVSIVKLGESIYEGNIDTLLAPDGADGSYFCFNGTDISSVSTTDINSTAWWKTHSNKIDSSTEAGLYRWNSTSTSWVKKTNKIGDNNTTLAIKKEPIRMKYKSTPHIVLKLTNPVTTNTDNKFVLKIVELYRDTTNAFGGTGLDALKANKWIPAGEPVAITDSESTVKVIKFEYGDTWFSRYDCLKTYPFTNEDINQIVEIGSFMLETHINIDGRYDRNRGQVNNLNMNPTNFNLLNKVYSQKNNFFTYYILDDSYYNLNHFPNQITWSTEKQPGTDIDNWTSMPLASTFNLDGSKGQIQALEVWNSLIFCFQDTGISNILFNSRVQIPTSDGVPIEITNNYKVDGKRYISEGLGCTNKFAICSTSNALYFIDAVSKHLHAISDKGIADISFQKNMTTWLGKQDISLWKPNSYTTRLFCDKNGNDIYIVTNNTSLCYNELIEQFTSFMSYSSIPVMFNVLDKFFCIKSNYINEMFAGEYNYFFGEYQGYDFTFVANGKTLNGDISTYDKIYSNMEFRADKWSDELDSILSSESPFDYVRVWNEYQDTGEVLLRATPDKPSILKKKFRVWRIDIPRDAHNRRDRMRNTWCKVKLGSAPRYNSSNNGFIQFHDVSMQYFI